jgi:hypothetical protein
MRSLRTRRVPEAIDREEEVALEIERRLPGRLVLASPDGTLHLGRNYEILRSNDDGATVARVSWLPRGGVRRATEWSRLACRLLRHEVRALAWLRDGSYVGANREGIFHGRAGDPTLRRSHVEVGDLPLMPPMRLTVGPDDVVLWGEYGSRRHARPVRLYASRDAGRSFEVVRTLEAGSVLHVHNVIYDAHLDLYWVLAGDHDHEPGIGRLSRDLTRFDWLVKGEQRFRAVVAFDFGDQLVYATDTERETNGLIVLEKASGRAERLRDFEGSCIYGCRYGGIHAITTTVEPSRVNHSPWASLWLSRDGLRWKRAYRARKDRWSADWFQFGSVVLPSGATERETIAFSGQAIETLDGETVVARLAQGASL